MNREQIIKTLKHHSDEIQGSLMIDESEFVRVAESILSEPEAMGELDKVTRIWNAAEKYILHELGEISEGDEGYDDDTPDLEDYYHSHHHKPVYEQHPEDFCNDCKLPNVSWFAQNDLWNKLCDRGEIICPKCFQKRADKAGLQVSFTTTLNNQLQYTEKEVTSIVTELWEKYSIRELRVRYSEFHSAIKHFIQFNYTKPVDEPKQLLNTTEGMSEEKVNMLLKFQIEECRHHYDRCSRDKGMTSKEVDQWIRETPLVDTYLTSNNQQTEGEETRMKDVGLAEQERQLRDVDVIEQIRVVMENCQELNMGNYNDDEVRDLNNCFIELLQIIDSQPQKADSEQTKK